MSSFIRRKVLVALAVIAMTACDSIDKVPTDYSGHPVANAGEDQTVKVATTVMLMGSGTDSDGTVASYLWLQTAGTPIAFDDVSITTPTFIAPLIAEKLVFRLTVTDDEGKSHSDTVNVVVELIPNSLPVANAGNDQNVDDGVVVTLHGLGTDEDGQITSYLWQQSGGTEVVLTDPTSATTEFKAPRTADVLLFTLTVTDDDGDTGEDTVSIVVEMVPNNPPVANAGKNQTVLEGEIVTLNGLGTDSDGTVVAYFWEQVTGASVTLSDNTITSPSFTAPLTPDIFTFRLTVTDDENATATDTVTVNVGYPYEAAQEIASLPYQRTDQGVFDTDADCSAFEPTYHPSDMINSGMNTIHQIQEGPIVAIWGEDYANLSSSERNTLTQLQSDTALRQNVVESLRELRRFIVEKHKVEVSPTLSPIDGKCYRVNLYMAGTGVYAGDTNPHVNGGAICDTGGAKEIPRIILPPGNLVAMATAGANIPWMVAHEYTHTLQCSVVRGDATGWSWYIESLANYFGNDAENITVGLDQFHQNTFWSIDAFFTRYGVWPFWMFLSSVFGYEFTGDVLQRISYPTESALEFLRRSSPFDCADEACRSEAFANLYGTFASSTVNYVSYSELEGFNYKDWAKNPWGGSWWGLHRLSAYMDQVGVDRYRIADWLAPQRFAHNIIQLIPDPGNNIVKITLDGWQIAERESEWRATVVATLDANAEPPLEAYGEIFKSGTQIINLADWEAELGSAIEELHIVVAAVPLNWKRDSDLSGFTEPERYRELDRYVYELTITGAWPKGHEPEALREVITDQGSRHINGGGFVASTAVVSATAYVGPKARVLGRAQVLANARIEGRSVVRDDAVVRDNAIISNNAEIRLRAVVKDFATVRDNAHMGDDAVVSGKGKVQGDAAGQRTYTVSNKGITMGVPLTETTLDVVVSGTAISDGARWLNSGTVSQGTPYDQWQIDDMGLLFKYDFEQPHAYRIRDVHASSDAYYLDLDGKATSAVPIQQDGDLMSNVLALDGTGYVDLPKWVLDQYSYRIKLQFKWNGSEPVAYLFDATTERGEQLALHVIRLTADTFDLKLVFIDRNLAGREIVLQNAILRKNQWLALSISYDADTLQMTMAVNPINSEQVVQAQMFSTYSTREFDYDTLKARIGNSIAGTNAFTGSLDNFIVERF